MDTSNLLPLDGLRSLNLEKTGEFQKLLYAFLLHFFLLIRLVLLNACTWSYKVLRQVGKVFSSQKDFKICQCKSVLKFMYLSWVLIRRFQFLEFTDIHVFMNYLETDIFQYKLSLHFVFISFEIHFVLP